MSVTVVGAMILREGTVLLGLRAPDRRICPGLWDFLGGHLEEGETPFEALRRELAEEVGVVPLDPRPLAVIDFSAEAGRTVHYALYAVTTFDGEPRLANEEHTALRWWPLQEAARLEGLASGRYRRFLREAAAEAGRATPRSEGARP